jgi:hypothetical protein
MSKFNALNTKLQSLLEEQSDLELLLNPLINWEDKDESYKNWLDFKYAGREFDISRRWKDKVQVEKFKKANAGNWDEKILNDNEEKRLIFLKLSKRKEELTEIILKVTDELITDKDVDLTDDQLKDIFK